MILHGPENVAGMAGLLAKAQRDLGLDSHAICYPRNNLTFDADFKFGAKSQIDGKGFLETLWLEFSKADVLHFYFGGSFLGRGLQDALLARFMGKKVFFTFLGCDIRDKQKRLASSNIEICKECHPYACSANRNSAMKIANDGKAPVFVTTPDLIDELPNAKWLPLPFDGQKIGFIKNHKRSDVFRIIHAPTDRSKKGTSHIIAAVADLQMSGLKIELKLCESKTQNQVFEIAKECDLAIDQIICGVYGTFGVEMMAHGLPTIAYIDERYRHRYPESLPIISANPDTIKDIIRKCYDEKIALSAVSKQSRDFAFAFHNNIAVAKRIGSYY